jgi:hypothetical protein
MNNVKQYWLFANTNEALSYGRFCSDKPHIVAKLESLRGDILHDYENEKSKADRDLQKMMNLAVQGQFHREAIDEAKKGNNP